MALPSCCGYSTSATNVNSRYGSCKAGRVAVVGLWKEVQGFLHSPTMTRLFFCGVTPTWYDTRYSSSSSSFRAIEAEIDERTLCSSTILQCILAGNVHNRLYPDCPIYIYISRRFRTPRCESLSGSGGGFSYRYSCISQRLLVVNLPMSNTRVQLL